MALDDLPGARGERPEPPFVTLPLHWERHGSAGSPLLLVHGFGTNGYTWNRWITPLSRDHPVFVVEMKGFGASPKPRDGKYGPQDQAALVHRLVLQQDLRDLTLIGHSLGGGVALLVALRLLREEPPRLRSLILIAGAVVPQPISGYLRLAGRSFVGPLLLSLLPIRHVVRKALRLAYFDPEKVTDAQVEAYARPLQSSNGRHALSATARQFLNPELRALHPRLAEITVPTFLLWGDHDRIVPLWVGRRAAELLPDAALEVLSDCGHMPQEERPAASLERVLAFLG